MASWEKILAIFRRSGLAENRYLRHFEPMTFQLAVRRGAALRVLVSKPSNPH